MRRRSNLLLLAACAVLLVSLAGCGKSATDADRSAVYAQQVRAITVSTRTKINAIAEHVSYTSAKSAADSVAQYAATIRAAASDLSRIPTPPAVAPAHRKLVALYRQTANRMDVIAGRFRTAHGSRAIAHDAQQLNAEVNAYSANESTIRGQIEHAITAATGPSTS